MLDKPSDYPTQASGKDSPEGKSTSKGPKDDLSDRYAAMEAIERAVRQGNLGITLPAQLVAPREGASVASPP